MPVARGELVARIDKLDAELARAATKSERRAGWVPEARAAVASWLADIRMSLLEPGELDPRNLPTAPETLRGLDAWGIDVGSHDPLTTEVLSLVAGVRKVR